MRFEYAIAPLGQGKHPSATFNTIYEAVDLSSLSSAMEWPGIRVAGALSGQTKLEWPLGRFVDRRGRGDLVVTPPADVTVLPRAIPPALELAEATHPRPWGPFNNDPRILGDVPVGGELHFTLDPEWITVAPSTMASPRTFVSFEGRTAYGERSAIPFHVTSADWEESDRVLAGIMTAFGVRHDGRGRRRQRRVRWRDATRLQAPAHRGALHGRPDARVGRHVGPRAPATSSSRTATSR